MEKQRLFFLMQEMPVRDLNDIAYANESVLVHQARYALYEQK